MILGRLGNGLEGKMETPGQTEMDFFPELVEESLTFISENEPPEGYFVAFSGGKDSIVMLDLIQKSGCKHSAFFNQTSIDPPEVLKFIRSEYPDVQWIRPDHTFFWYIKKKWPPTVMKRWCCDILKESAGKDLKRQYSKHAIGIRADESKSRASRPRIDIHHKLSLKKKPIYVLKPIFRWRECDVWRYIEDQKLAYPCLYDEGFSRIGCIVCPFICRPDRKQIDYHKARWPKKYEAFELAVSGWWDTLEEKRGAFKELESVDEYLDNWYRGIR